MPLSMDKVFYQAFQFSAYLDLEEQEIGLSEIKAEPPHTLRLRRAHQPGHDMGEVFAARSSGDLRVRIYTRREENKPRSWREYLLEYKEVEHLPLALSAQAGEVAMDEIVLKGVRYLWKRDEEDQAA